MPAAGRSPDRRLNDLNTFLGARGDVVQLRDRIKELRRVPASELRPNPKNWRTHPEAQQNALRGVLAEIGIANAVLARELPDGSLMLIDGHLRAETLGQETVPVLVLDVNEAEADKLLLTIDPLAALAERNEEKLRELAAEVDTENDAVQRMIDELLGEEIVVDEDSGSDAGGAGGEPSRKLTERFGIAPFSVFNAREGWWQDRKRKWVELGIRSERGRDAPPGGSPMVGGYDENGNRLVGFGKTLGNAADLKRQHVDGVLMKSDSGNDPAYYFKKQEVEKRLGRTLTTEEFQRDFYEGPDTYESGTSIFDPVLCEIAYRWFCPSGGSVFDPFAGGSVRGIVAARLGRKYIGHELRAEQVAENEKQRASIVAASSPQPEWIVGDSRGLDQTCGSLSVDMVFSCPPYADLEVYSDDPADLSNMPYEQFVEAYREIIAKSCALLRPDRFACFVVGDVRDRRGNYRNFVGDTVQAFRDAGLQLYNEAILVTSVGSLPIRVGKQFEASRKLGKTHQNVLVFVKGDGKAATKACGECEFGLPDAAEDFGEVVTHDS
jgi:hypothetical protein